MLPLPPVTQFLMLFCTAVFCVDWLLGFSLSGLFALWPLQSGRFMPWQTVTYAFLHGSLPHLFFNMLGLWMFGSELERLWGAKRFVQFMAASILAAAAVQLVVTLLTYPAPTIGISGGLYGLLLAYGMLFPNRTIMPLFPPIPMKARTFVIVFGLLELFFGLQPMGGGVAHFAHLGGMLGGWLMITYWRGGPPFGRGRRGGSGHLH